MDDILFFLIVSGYLMLFLEGWKINGNAVNHYALGILSMALFIQLAQHFLGISDLQLLMVISSILPIGILIYIIFSKKYHVSFGEIYFFQIPILFFYVSAGVNIIYMYVVIGGLWLLAYYKLRFRKNNSK